MPKLTRTQWIVLAALLVIVLSIAVIVHERISPAGVFADLQHDLVAIDPPEGLEYTDLSGNIVNLRDFKGKPMVINAWASWMPFSAQELPVLDAVAGEYGDRITVLAINRMEERTLASAYLGTLSPLSHLHVLADPADTFFKGVGGYAMPETVVYAADGSIALHTRGVLVEAELRAALDALLAE